MLASNYVHIGIIHIFFNMWCLWNLGLLAERIFDRWSYLLVYTASGIAGSMASLWWHPGGIGAGASGAIFGLAGGLIAVLYLGKLPIAKDALKPTLKSLIMFAAYNLFFGLAPGIDNSAHLGGLAAGLGRGRGPGWKLLGTAGDPCAAGVTTLWWARCYCSCLRNNYLQAQSGPSSQPNQSLMAPFGFFSHTDLASDLVWTGQARGPGNAPLRQPRLPSGLMSLMTRRDFFKMSQPSPFYYCESLFVLAVVVTHQVRCVAAHGVYSLLTSVGLENDPHRTPLPARCRALRIGRSIAPGFSERFLQDRLPASNLEHDGKEFPTVIGDATIGGVVAIPAGHRIVGIELRAERGHET